MHHLCFMGLLIPPFLLSITIIIIVIIISISMIIIFDFVSVIEMFFSQPKGSNFFFCFSSQFHQGSGRVGETGNYVVHGCQLGLNYGTCTSADDEQTKICFTWEEISLFFTKE